MSVKEGTGGECGKTHGEFHGDSEGGWFCASPRKGSIKGDPGGEPAAAVSLCDVIIPPTMWAIELSRVGQNC